MDLFDAIFFRKSIRKYADHPLPPEVLETIRNLCGKSETLYEKIPIRVHIVESGQDIQHLGGTLIGNYTKVKAPHYLVVTSEETDGYLENIGYALEHLILQLTSMGIGTCWIGGMVKGCPLDRIVPIDKNHIPVMVIAFGAPFHEGELTANIVESKKRKEIKEFVEGAMDKDLLRIMDSVRLAPSSMNSQPWRFSVKDSEIDVYARIRGFLGIQPLELLNRIDVGIALCHFAVASAHFSMPFSFRRLSGRERDGLSYITTIQRISFI
jgi:nitroreductase